jgi:putative ABC transport system permease protein
MTILLRAWAAIVLAIRRLLSQWALALATLVGLIVAVALAVSIPLYADAVYFRIFETELSKPANKGPVSPSPFAFVFGYYGAWDGEVEWEEVQPLDAYLVSSASRALGLPQELFVRHLKTDTFRLFPEGEDLGYADKKDPLAWIDFAFISGLENHITLIEGRFPEPALSSSDSIVEALVSQALANELGLQVGEVYLTFNSRKIDETRYTAQIPVRIAGVWQASDPLDKYWFYRPTAFDNTLLIPEPSFLERISPYMKKEIRFASWYMVLDGSNVHVSDAARLLSHITAIQQRTNSLLPHTRLNVSPEDGLRKYQEESELLTLLLYAYSVPILVLIAIFVNLVVSLAVSRKINEIAILRSRGATIAQVIGITVLEGLILGGLALVLGLPVGQGIAEIIGQTRSFLNFTAGADLRIGITATTWRVGLIAVGIALVAQVAPTLSAARHTIVTYKQERARLMRPPWWQRVWLDVLLLIPAAYGAYVLQQQGSIALAGKEGAINNDPFQNPLLLLIPALGIIALTLLFLRLLPLMMRVLGWMIAQIGGVGMLLATRQLARMPGFYTGPMLLLVLTLSLSAFTASLAQTLDFHLYDQVYYQVGADMSLAEIGDVRQSIGLESIGATQEEPQTEAPEGPRWFFLPVSEYLKVPGIQAATRVGRFAAITLLSGNRQEATFIGVDRTEFPSAAFWRWDFAPSYLGELMNALALASDGVLLPKDFMRQHALKPGDTFQMQVLIYGNKVEFDATVRGGFDYFPTWYPEKDGPLIVGNLDYLFESAGSQYPYDLWLKTAPGTDRAQLIRDIRTINPYIFAWSDPLDKLTEAQQRPERQGLFGLLSVGFGAAALLTILGFVLYAFFSFRQRFIELGVLRAIGLSTGQMVIFLAWELAALILTGLVLGTGLGIWVSQLFIPYLQLGASPEALRPPFLVEIAWPAIFRIYALFGVLFVAALIGLTGLLLRMKIFEAVKLGETV